MKKQPITFDRQNSSFRLPNVTPFPRFSLADVNPSLSRSASTFSYAVDRKLSSTPSIPESNSSESFTDLHDTEHKGQHKDCPACRKTLEILRRHRQQKSPQLGMFSLPRENEAYEVEREGRKS